MTKFSRLTAPAALAAALGAAAAGSAADGPAEGMDGGPRMRLDFEAIDTNADASLSREELTVRAAARIGEVDANGDGVLSRDELIAAMPAPRGGAMQFVFTVDPAEARADRLLAFVGATEAGQIEVAVLSERQVNGLLARLDSDRDGAVSREEAEAMTERRAERWHQRHERRGEERQRF